MSNDDRLLDGKLVLVCDDERRIIQFVRVNFEMRGARVVEASEGDACLDLIRRADKFDPSKASFDTFADRVVANRVSSLASPTNALRAERGMQSLEAPVGGVSDDGGLTLSDVLPEASAIDPVDDFSLTHGPGLRGDVGKLLAALCPASRRVAIAVSHLSVAQTARALGLHRSTVYERLAAIRETAATLGLDGYFEPGPTVAPARR